MLVVGMVVMMTVMVMILDTSVLVAMMLHHADGAHGLDGGLPWHCSWGSGDRMVLKSTVEGLDGAHLQLMVFVISEVVGKRLVACMNGSMTVAVSATKSWWGLAMWNGGWV